MWIVFYRDSFVLLPDSLGIAVRFENFSKKFSFRMSQMRFFATIYYERTFIYYDERRKDYEKHV